MLLTGIFFKRKSIVAFPKGPVEANEKMKKYILSNDHQALINYCAQGKAFGMAIPTPEHFLPLLYVLALKEENEKVVIFNDTPVMGSLTMTSLKIAPGK